MKKFYYIIIPILILCAISIITLYINNIDYCFKQIIWFCCGFILIIINKYWNNNIFKYSKFLYLFNVFLLGLVLIIGKEINGARAWFSFKYFSFQPSELMKLTMAFYLSDIFSKKKRLYIVKSFVVFIIPSILVYVEPDTGAIIMYLIIYFSMLLSSLEGKKRSYFILSLGIIISIGGFILINNNYITSSYRFKRIITINNNYQINNALISLGSSSLIGRVKSNIYVPESLTDFMFVKSSSDLGYLVSVGIVINYFIILVLLYKHKNSLFDISFFWLFFFQVIYNILMNLGVVPIMGIPLPFLSYGGTNTIIYFLFLSYIFNEKKKLVI